MSKTIAIRLTTNTFYKFKVLLVLSFMVLPALSGFAQSQSTASQKSKVADSLYTQAQLALTIDGDYQTAKELFEKVALLQEDNAQVYAELTRIYVAEKNYPKAIQELKKAIYWDKENIDYQKHLANLLLQTQSYKEAADLLTQLAAKELDPNEYLYNAIFAYGIIKDYENALKALRLIKPEGKAEKERFLNEKIRLFAHLNLRDSVSIIAHQLIALNPDNADNYVVASISETLAENGKAAVQTMDSAVKRFPKNPKVVQQAIKVYAQWDTIKLEQFYNQIVHSKDFNEKEKTIAFYPLIDEMNQNKTAYRLVHKKLPELSFGSKQNSFAVSLYAAILALEGREQESLNIYKKGVAADSANFLLWHGILQSFHRQNQYDSIALYNTTAKRLLPANRVPHYYDAIVNLLQNNQLNAIKAMEKAKQLQEGDSVVSDFVVFSFLGDMYESTKNRDKAINNYKEAIRLNPNAANVLNNYSYLLAELGTNLDTAKILSARALRSNPDEPMYLDTYGWILYKLKDYNNAKVYIQRALEYSSEPDPVLLDHLGDIEYALGNFSNAKKYWEQSLGLNPKNEEIKSKLKKLKKTKR